MTSHVSSENTVLVSTTMPANEVAEKRRNNLTNQMSKFGIPVFFDYGIPLSQENHILDVQYKIMKKRMENFMRFSTAKNEGPTYAILCDDDFHPHSRLLDELNHTVSLLPENWRSLHLCPGTLWGRSIHRNQTILPAQEGRLVPEGNISKLEFHPCGRYFHNCGSGIWNGTCVWLGGPIAMLVRRDSVKSLYDDFCSLYVRENNPNDVILTNILTNRDYVCREPQLGWENECGGSCFG